MAPLSRRSGGERWPTSTAAQTCCILMMWVTRKISCVAWNLMAAAMVFCGKPKSRKKMWVKSSGATWILNVFDAVIYVSYEIVLFASG